MRRWLALLLLVLLPLQSSWAVVAGYCGHETGVAAKHVGHHDKAAHGHGDGLADGSGESRNDGPSTPSAGADCGHCHGAGVGMLDVPAALEPVAPCSAPPGAGHACRASHPPAQPERPQWARLA
jgi:hypothetical protein